MSLQVTFTADDASSLAGLVASFSNPASLGDTLMPQFDELRAKIQEVKDAVATGKADVLAAIDAEKSQVADAVAAFEGRLGDVLTPDQMSQLTGDLDSLKASFAGTEVRDAVSGIFEPAPADTGTPAPPPPDTGTPTTGEGTTPPPPSAAPTFGPGPQPKKNP